MTKIKHEFQVIVYSDTDNPAYQNMTPLDVGQLLQDHIRVILTQKGIGYDRVVFHRGYNYVPVDDVDLD